MNEPERHVFVLHSQLPGAAAAESITNVQHAGVDEGGIVKTHGDMLVILRRGRLFTVRIGGEQLAPISVVDAFGPGMDPGGAWYDEMLIEGNTVVVIGYSYRRDGTEIGLFDIAANGTLTYRATHHLRSNDYYSSRNYASRLIGSKLVFYTPLALNPLRGNWESQLPAHRIWRDGATAADFKRIAPATRIYRTDDDLDPLGGVALHTVSICDLAVSPLRCESTAVLGRPGRVFYVSPDSVFVWTTDWSRRRGASGSAGSAQSAVFRIPLDGTAPTGLKVAGSPIDQLSFLAGSDGYLNVLVRADGTGEGMWRAEVKGGDLAFLRVPLASFGDGTERAPASLYTPLPPAAGGFAIQNRYVGNYLLYGTGTGWGRPQARGESAARALRYAGDREVFTLALPHGIDRIEAMGPHAVLVGSDGKDLHFTSVRLSGLPVVIDRYTQPNAAQGETRTHGFFFRADGAYDGWVGLPIVSGDEPAMGQLRKTAAQVLYLRSESLKLRTMGALAAHSDRTPDSCRASCVDWYGNARPIFLGKRVFALMGYEIVEGRLTADHISELRRINFAPSGGVIGR